MSALPGSLETDNQPPLTVPLRHFFVGLGFLCAAIIVGLLDQLLTFSAFTGVVHLHLLLAGWVCVTIMGAMTQFVPVWSGTQIHSRRLANAQLLLVTVGLSGFALALVFGWLALLGIVGLVMMVGFWLFIYNLIRTLQPMTGLDVTERHFIFALACFFVLTTFGVLLAVNLTYNTTASLPITHGSLLGSHLTIAVFGAVLTTIYGAIYQLGTMFTQTKLHGIDHQIQTFQELAQYLGVALLAGGRLIEDLLIARVGGILVLLAALSVAFIIGRKLLEMQVDWTPMHRRYVIGVVSLVFWSVGTLFTWTRDPLAYDYLFGNPGTIHILLLGVIGFVVLGTLYHIIPFIIWIDHYSDRLGLEKVPMIDDLYNQRVAMVEFSLLLSGLAILVLTDGGILNESYNILGLGVFGIAVLLFIGNMTAVVYRHSSYSIQGLLFGTTAVSSNQ